MTIVLVLKDDEYDDSDRHDEWGQIKGVLDLSHYIIPSEFNVSETHFCIITHRKEYNEISDSNELPEDLPVIVYSGGYSHVTIDKVRPLTYWFPFPGSYEQRSSLCNQLKNVKNRKEAKNIVEGVLNVGCTMLVSLSILCQGYLAAHWEELGEDELEKVLKGWDSLPPEFKNTVKGKKDDTEKASWWKPPIDIGKAENELKEKGDNRAVKNLLDAINGKNGKILTEKNGINIVIEANGVLPRILKG